MKKKELKIINVSKNEVLDKLNKYLNNQKEWDEIHRWFLWLTSNFDKIVYESPFEDVLDALETIFLMDKKDANEFRASDDEIRKVIKDIETIERLIKKEGLENVVKRFRKERKIEAEKRVQEFKNRHDRRKKN